jgi:hypothetical protein
MYTYKITGVSTTDKWIYIGCNEESSMLNYEPFVELLKHIAQKWNNGEWYGKLSSVGDMRYKINNDPIKLIYQWDDLFGIVFDYQNSIDSNYVKTFLADNYDIR